MILYGNNVQTNYDYEHKTFRWITVKTQRGEDSLHDLFYSYDPVGNITHIEDNADIPYFLTVN
jgi:hypothetical protein